MSFTGECAVELAFAAFTASFTADACPGGLLRLCLHNAAFHAEAIGTASAACQVVCRAFSVPGVSCES